MSEPSQMIEVHDEYPKNLNWNSKPCIENFVHSVYVLAIWD
jgi:hypothetical protein